MVCAEKVELVHRLHTEGCVYCVVLVFVFGVALYFCDGYAFSFQTVVIAVKYSHAQSLRILFLHQHLVIYDVLVEK